MVIRPDDVLADAVELQNSIIVKVKTISFFTKILQMINIVLFKYILPENNTNCYLR